MNFSHWRQRKPRYFMQNVYKQLSHVWRAIFCDVYWVETVQEHRIRNFSPYDNLRRFRMKSAKETVCKFVWPVCKLKVILWALQVWTSAGCFPSFWWLTGERKSHIIDYLLISVRLARLCLAKVKSSSQQQHWRSMKRSFTCPIKHTHKRKSNCIASSLLLA